MGSKIEIKELFSEAQSANNNPLFNVGTANNADNGTVDIYIRAGASLNHPRSIGIAFDDTWHHVAWTAQGKVMDLYIDGVFDSQFDYNAINDFIPTTTTIGGFSEEAIVVTILVTSTRSLFGILFLALTILLHWQRAHLRMNSLE